MANLYTALSSALAGRGYPCDPPRLVREGGRSGQPAQDDAASLRLRGHEISPTLNTLVYHARVALSADDFQKLILAGGQHAAPSPLEETLELRMGVQDDILMEGEGVRLPCVRISLRGAKAEYHAAPSLYWLSPEAKAQVLRLPSADPALPDALRLALDLWEGAYIGPH